MKLENLLLLKKLKLLLCVEHVQHSLNLFHYGCDHGIAVTVGSYLTCGVLFDVIVRSKPKESGDYPNLIKIRSLFMTSCVRLTILVDIYTYIDKQRKHSLAIIYNLVKVYVIIYTNV